MILGEGEGREPVGGCVALEGGVLAHGEAARACAARQRLGVVVLPRGPG